jgi:hypothetical protein
MSWSVLVLATDANNAVNLQFTDSVSGKIYTNWYPIPPGAPATFIPDTAATVIANLTAQQAAVSAVPAPGQPVIPTPIPMPVIDPNAAIKTQFLTDYTLLKQMQVAISHNILLATDLTFTAQLAKVTSELSANSAILLPLIQVGP